ncbi:MAG: hypothetical protein HMLKMBBP_00892 [Planctomycetes bacterium]|nr:hypothetical protein [Planctomycetota bacterium]
MTGASEPAAEPRAGSLLVAAPSMLDPNFMHTVVLLCAHSPDGSLGFVLNRPSPVSTSDLDSELELLATRKESLFTGGPVSPRELHVLHRTGRGVPGSLPVVDGVALDGEPDALHAALSDADPAVARVRFVAGYAGWSAGQLDAELAESSWIVCPADARTIFDGRPETLWRRVLRAQGGATAALADLPPDPSWN